MKRTEEKPVSPGPMPGETAKDGLLLLAAGLFGSHYRFFLRRNGGGFGFLLHGFLRVGFRGFIAHNFMFFICRFTCRQNVSFSGGRLIMVITEAIVNGAYHFI